MPLLKDILFFAKKLFHKKTSQDNEDKTSDDYMPSTLEMLRFLLKFLNLKWKNIIFLNLTGIFSCLIIARQPFIILDLQTAIENNDQSSIIWLVVEYIIYEIFYMPFNYFENTIHESESQLTEQSIQKQIMKHLLSLDVQYFEDHKATQIAQIVTTGTQHISSQLHFGTISTNIKEGICYVGTLFFLFKQSNMLFLILIVFGFLSAFVYSYVTSLEQKVLKLQDEQEECKSFALDDILINISSIKSFGSEEKELRNMDNIIKQNVILKSKSSRFSSVKNMILYSSFSVLRIIVVLKVVYNYFTISEGRDVLLRSYAQIITDIYNIQHFCNFIVRSFMGTEEFYYDDSKKGIGKVMKLFEEKSQFGEGNSQRDSSDSRENNETAVTLLKGDINFENVCFKYPASKDKLAEINRDSTYKEDCEDDQIIKPELSDSNSEEDELQLQQNENDQKLEKKENVLSNLSFEIKKGQCVAFVGMSGSGKSTIVKLLERFYDVSSGNILFDGKNIKDISLTQLRRSIGLVSQEPSLFDNDIEYNITYGCIDDRYTQKELLQICDVSGVSEFAMDAKRFPEGLKTLVGTKGMKLSGGQKQRIAIARALMKKPTILILDEATSSLDAESEHVVQTYIDKLVENKGLTIIVIAHRLSTVINSDKIFVMKNGQIQEQGKHQELLEKNDVYSRLIHHQIKSAKMHQKNSE